MSSILDRFRLDGQVAIITGSGRGIGAGTALAYADAGADIVLSARTQSQLEDTAEKVRARGRRALVVQCDVLVQEQREELVAKAIEEFSRLDILVNNAGGWPPKPTLDTSESEFEACFRFNGEPIKRDSEATRSAPCSSVNWVISSRTAMVSFNKCTETIYSSWPWSRIRESRSSISFPRSSECRHPTQFQRPCNSRTKAAIRGRG